MAEFDIGFLGGGQLARMSIQAAQRMGFTCLSLDPGAVTPASQVADAIVGKLDDRDKIAALAVRCERLTLENEFIPAEAILEGLKRAGIGEERLVPRLSALATIQDKLTQRQALINAGVPCPQAIALEGDGGQAIEEIGFPMVLKVRFGGYDGKGTRYANSKSELDSHASSWTNGGWLAESFVPFKREVAAMVAISEDGSAVAFPTMETVQVDSVCDLVFPSGTDASKVAIKAAKAMGGHGLFGVEMFELEDGSIQVNELAPRPHNTGHYTLDWGGVSQFEQHIRLVMGLPLATPDGAETCMANLLGQGGSDDFKAGIKAALATEPGAHVHWYGKVESRKGRKMGHINVVGAHCVERAKQARAAFYKAAAK